VFSFRKNPAPAMSIETSQVAIIVVSSFGQAYTTSWHHFQTL
jgi:hypothetical protein